MKIVAISGSSKTNSHFSGTTPPVRKRSGLFANRRRTAMCMLLGFMAGCHGHEKSSANSSLPQTQPEAVEIGTTAPASRTALVEWEDSAKGVRLSYPSTWKRVKNPDYELTLLPQGATSEDRRITMDIPELPPHLPWMIQMSRVEHDYLDDLKKQHSDLKVQESKDGKVPNSTSRIVASVWHEGKTPHEDIVLLMIHASAVYILDAQTDDPHLADTRGVFDSIESSLRWK